VHKVIPRHRGRIIKLEYNPVGSIIDTTLYLVGKGINYDTGGADVKAGGHMSGMHRDKCGAAFVAGFFKTLEILKPQGLRVFGDLCMARNSIGEGRAFTNKQVTRLDQTMK
jgi:leucyl aminopeptidase